jgi:hypothetical protein
VPISRCIASAAHGIGAVRGARERHAEQRHDAVAVRLVDVAAISPDDLARGTEEIVELREDLVRLHARAVGREVDDVGEHHRHVQPPREQLVLQHQRDDFARRHAAQQALAQILLAPDLIKRARQLRRARRHAGFQGLVEMQQLGIRRIEFARVLDGIEVHLRIVDAGGDLNADDRQQHFVKFVEPARRFALDAEHADQPVLHDKRDRQLALRMGKARHLRHRRKRTRPCGFRAGAHAGEIGALRGHIAHAQHLPPPRRDAEHALSDDDLGAGSAIVAPARRHLEHALVGARQQDHAVPESQHRLHGIETDGEDAIEVERGADLRRDLLDDPHLVGLARKLVVERVDDLLIVDYLVA